MAEIEIEDRNMNLKQERIRSPKPREFNIETIKTILAQNQVILDMNMLLLKHLASPPVQYNENE